MISFSGVLKCLRATGKKQDSGKFYIKRLSTAHYKQPRSCRSQQWDGSSQRENASSPVSSEAASPTFSSFNRLKMLTSRLAYTYARILTMLLVEVYYCECLVCSHLIQSNLFREVNSLRSWAYQGVKWSQNFMCLRRVWDIALLFPHSFF